MQGIRDCCILKKIIGYLFVKYGFQYKSCIGNIGIVVNYIQVIGNVIIVNIFFFYRGVNLIIDIIEFVGVLDKVGKEEFVVMVV